MTDTQKKQIIFEKYQKNLFDLAQQYQPKDLTTERINEREKKAQEFKNIFEEELKKYDEEAKLKRDADLAIGRIKSAIEQRAGTLSSGGLDIAKNLFVTVSQLEELKILFIECNKIFSNILEEEILNKDRPK